MWRNLSAMKYILAAMAMLFVVAATPAEVGPIATANGYYIQDGADATPRVLGDAVADARFAGGELSVIVLSTEPPSGATTFADAILDQYGQKTGTILVVAPQTVGWASQGDIWTDGQLDTALTSSLVGDTSDDVVRLFVQGLTSKDAAGSGGGGFGIWWFFGIIGVAIGAFMLFAKRAANKMRGQARDRVEELRAMAQEQIDTIANDILDLEDEVRVSGNTEAQMHYAAAVETYSTAGERLAAATSGREIVDLDHEFDIAVWNLDAAEAILDGDPVPDKPERPKYEPVQQPAPSAPPSPTELRPLDPPRRSTRQSSYGTLRSVAEAMAAGALLGPGGGFPGMPGRSSSRSRRGGGRGRSSPRRRGGGRRR